ncbi:MAG: hypothetical protein ACE366_20560 [Bradymonadia bacterium]
MRGARWRWGALWVSVWGLLMMASTAWGAVPNRNLSFVAVATDDTPWVRASAARVARHAEARLGLNPRKVHVIDGPPTVQSFLKLFSEGRPFQYVSQSDLMVVYLAGAQQTPNGVALADGVVDWATLATLGDRLRQGPGEDLGFFDGTVLLVLDGLGKRPERIFELKPGFAALTLSSESRDPWPLDGAVPASAGATVAAGVGALAEVPMPEGEGGGVANMVSPGAVAWAGALEQLLADPETRGEDINALSKALKKSRRETGVKSTLARGRDFTPRRFRLLLSRLRVVVHPRLLQNVETVALLDRLKSEIEQAAPESLRPFVEIVRSEVGDPAADIDCQALANAQMAYLECVEGRTPLFADRIDISEPRSALAPVVQQILRDYKKLVARDWSTRRSDLRPLEIVALVDQSLSMAWHDPVNATDPLLPTSAPAKREVALTRMAATLGAHAMSTGQPARLQVLLFGDEVRPMKGPKGETWIEIDGRLSGAQLGQLVSAFRAASRPSRYTGISAALDAAAARFADRDAEAARHVILITDGRESVVRTDPRGAVKAAAARVQAMGATLHTVGLAESSGRLPGYLDRMRAGGKVLERYVDLMPMAFAPARCRDTAQWKEDDAEACGGFYAGIIEEIGAFDPGLLDEIRRSTRGGVSTGVALLATDRGQFQRQLPELLSALTGEGVYATRHGVRQPNPLDPSIVLDTWRFDLDLRTAARVLIYNRDALDFTEWSVLKDGRRVSLEEGLEVLHESDAVTVVTLPAPARGVWIVQRQGKRSPDEAQTSQTGATREL